MKKIIFMSLLAAISLQADIICKTEKAMATYVDLVAEENLVGVLRLFENDCKKLDPTTKITDKYDIGKNITEIQLLEGGAHKNYWILNNNSDKKEAETPEQKKSSADIEAYINAHV